MACQRDAALSAGSVVAPLSRTLMLATLAASLSACSHAPWASKPDAASAGAAASAASAPAPPPVAVTGTGFSSLPPTGQGWRLEHKGADEVVYVRPEVAGPQDSDESPYFVVTGVRSLPAPASGEFKSTVQRWLRDTLFDTRLRQTIDLQVRDAPWQGRPCVEYESRQVEYDRPERSTPLQQFDQQGRICLLDRTAAGQPTRWLQAYRSERHPRLDGPPVHGHAWEWAKGFIEQVQITAP